jgi:hypothetical protein
MAMENETKALLALTAQTICAVIIWFLINILVGIFWKYGLFEKTPSVKNILYYLFFIAGSLLLARYYIKKWKKVDFDF